MLRSLRRIVLALVALAGVGAVALLLGAGTALCGRERVTPARSPAGTYTVVVATSGCGATTANTTRIALAKTNWLHSERDLFTITPSWAASVWQDPALAPMRFRWPDDSTLVVEHRASAPPPSRPPRLFEVVVRYAPVSR